MKLFLNSQISHYSTMLFRLAGVSNADVVTVSVAFAQFVASLFTVSLQYFFLVPSWLFQNKFSSLSPSGSPHWSCGEENSTTVWSGRHGNPLLHCSAPGVAMVPPEPSLPLHQEKGTEGCHQRWVCLLMWLPCDHHVTYCTYQIFYTALIRLRGNVAEIRAEKNEMKVNIIFMQLNWISTIYHIMSCDIMLHHMILQYMYH